MLSEKALDHEGHEEHEEEPTRRIFQVFVLLATIVSQHLALLLDPERL